MKKLFAAVALVAALSVAGKAHAQLTVNLGYAPETFKTTTSVLSQSLTESQNYQGFFAGVTYNIALVKGLGLATGAEVRMNMKSSEANLLGVVTSTKDRQFLIDVPVLLNYGFKINRDITITPFAGPMLSLAASGKTDTKTFFGDTQLTDTDFDWYGDNSDLGRFNLYGVFGGAIGYKQFNLFAGYRAGFLDLYGNENATLKTNGFFIGLGFGF